MTFNDIKHGDSVTILVHAGIGRNGPEQKPAKGKAVMRSGDGRGWVLNMGGRYGTPGLAYPENTVAVRGKKLAPPD